MNLLECDGKALLSRHGVEIPRGALWPSLPESVGRLVVKAQVPSGKRGQSGGIQFADDPEQASALAGSLRGRRIGQHEIGAIYIEERLDIVRELYLAVALDRDAGCLTIIASPEGGMSIEDVDDERILKLAIDPLLGLRPFHVAEVARFLADGAAGADALAAVIEAVYAIAIAEDAELVEINPLALLGDGRAVAADAKVVLDDNAAFRRTFSADTSVGLDSAQSALERAIARTGAVGVEIDAGGDVVAVVSGAGLMMATLDLLKDAGLSIRCVIDLGGTVLAGGDGLRRVFEAVAGTAPAVTFLNAFMHTAMCDEFAEMLGLAQEAAPLSGRVVVRLKGRKAEAGREMLKRRGFEVHEDLEPAISSLAGPAGRQ